MISVDEVIYLLSVAMLCGLCGWELHYQHRCVVSPSYRRYSPIVGSVFRLPLLFFLFLLSALADVYYMELFCSFAIGLSLYALVLLPLLPVLRRRFSARCCGVLWFLPGGFYYLDMLYRGFRKPLILIPVTQALLHTLCKVWLWGILVIIVWNVCSHLLFRRRVMKYAEPVREQWIRVLWEGEKARVLPRMLDTKLVTSFEVRSPVSIGVFQGTTVVVLPQRVYTADELQLIFRHELIHISRNDGMNKLYLLFCTAVCWFNPLVWIMRRKSAEDLERSCDESVLLEADMDTRREYAHLVLNAAGEERGFTSCLAASATSMRYRLKSIVQERAKYSGVLLAIVLGIAISASSGMVTPAYDYTTAWAVVEERGGDRVVSASMEGKGECVDLSAVEGILAELQVCTIAGDRRDLSEALARVEVDDLVILYFHRQTIEVTGGGEQGYYYLPAGMDWAYFESLFA